MINDDQLVKDCMRQNKLAQQELYNKYSPVMRAICFRYADDKEEAKDILQDGFIKVFLNIAQFKFKGSLEGWIRRIMINTAIGYYNKKKRKSEVVLVEEIHELPEESKDSFDGENSTENPFLFDVILDADLSQEELLEALNILKPEFRIVFNLFFLEEFPHKDIATLLNIDEKTSRTRLFRARNKVQKHLYELSLEKLEDKRKLRRL